MGSRSAETDKLHVPPRPMCPETLRTEMTWEELSGRGVLVAYSVVHIAPTAMVEAGYGRGAPYCVGVVQLEEGPRMSGQILGVDVARPESIRIGSAVEARFLEEGEGDSREVRLAFEAKS